MLPQLLVPLGYNACPFRKTEDSLLTRAPNKD